MALSDPKFGSEALIATGLHGEFQLATSWRNPRDKVSDNARGCLDRNRKAEYQRSIAVDSR